MAVNRSQFINNVDKCLKANKDYTKFYISFRKDTKLKQKILDYSNNQWDKRTRIMKAKAELLEERNKESNLDIAFNENSSLNSIAEIYFNTACDIKSNWTIERKNAYNLYCKDSIGKKKIRNIKMLDIDLIRKSMETKGHSKQTQNGCSPRTIKKVLMQSLKPILQYAVDNKAIESIPKINLPKPTKQKKIVNDAGKKLAILYKAIVTRYADNPFYRALFLFALYGRRWNEIRTILWSDLDILNNTYTIRAENNKIGLDQTYDLPIPIHEALSNIKDDHKGLIFKSPITGKELYSPKKQLSNIKKDTGIDELTMHYFRHILVSAMGESGVAGTVLSASLGHTNLDTVNQFYLSANHQKSSQTANIAIEKLTKDKI